MLFINPAQLIELMIWACERVRHRCCGSVCLDFFNLEARIKEKEIQQTKDEISIVSKKWRVETENMISNSSKQNGILVFAKK